MARVQIKVVELGVCHKIAEEKTSSPFWSRVKTLEAKRSRPMNRLFVSCAGHLLDQPANPGFYRYSVLFLFKSICGDYTNINIRRRPIMCTMFIFLFRRIIIVTELVSIRIYLRVRKNYDEVDGGFSYL